MNREIKYRAWQKAHCKMFYKVNLYALGGTKMDKAQLDSRQVFDTIGVSCDVMQFVNLKDKVGKEVYDGDIVISGGKGIKVVAWDEVQLCFVLVWVGQYKEFLEKGAALHGGTYEKVTRSKQVRVVGNIYENPYLLLTENV